MKTVWISLKFIYLYLAYWLVGLTEEDLYITKGNYFADLGKFHSAIFAYKKALKESEIPSIYAAIGWCHLSMDEDTKALEYYRKAYEKINRYDVSVTLAFLEMENGNFEECRKVFINIKEKRDELPDESLKLYDQVKDYLAKSESENK